MRKEEARAEELKKRNKGRPEDRRKRRKESRGQGRENESK